MSWGSHIAWTFSGWSGLSALVLIGLRVLSFFSPIPCRLQHFHSFDAPSPRDRQMRNMVLSLKGLNLVSRQYCVYCRTIFWGIIWRITFWTSMTSPEDSFRRLWPKGRSCTKCGLFIKLMKWSSCLISILIHVVGCSGTGAPRPLRLYWALKAKSICSLMLVDHKLSPLHSLILQRKTMEKGYLLELATAWVHCGWLHHHWFRTIPNVPKHLLSNPQVWRLRHELDNHSLFRMVNNDPPAMRKTRYTMLFHTHSDKAHSDKDERRHRQFIYILTLLIDSLWQAFAEGWLQFSIRHRPLWSN